MRSNPVLRLMVGVVFLFFSLPGLSGHCFAQGVPAAAPDLSPGQTLTIPAPSTPPTAPQTNPQSAAPDYSKEAYVIDQYDIDINVQADGTWQQVATVVVQVKSQAGIREFGNLSIPYESRNQKVDFTYIRIRKPDGSVVEIPPAYIQDMPAGVTMQAPMHSDLHIKQVPVTNLNPGDTLMYQFKVDQFQAEVPNQFWLAQNFFKAGIVLKQQVEIRFPASKHVQVESAEAQPTIHREGNVTVYDWKTSHLHPEPSDRKSLALKVDEKPSIQITSFENWQQVGDWYRNLQSTRVAVTPAIQQKEQELTKGLTTDDAKQRAIYAYVATQFRYIGLSFGIGRYQPHAADDVLQNKFGDCKDKHTLFAALMKAAGYDVSPALIGATNKLDETIPYPGQFDHVISVLRQGDKETWLDTTEEVAPYGILASTLRGKMALVMPATGPPKLERTPMNPPFPEADNFTMKASLGGDVVLTGHADFTTRGDMELILRAGFHLTPEADWTKLGQNVSYMLGFSGDVSNVLADNPDDTSKPFHVSYDYKRKDYSGEDGKQITPPLPPAIFTLSELDAQPKEPIVLGAPGVRDYRATVDMPKGSVVTLPADVDIVAPFAEYRESASVKGGVLSAQRIYTIKQAKLPVDKWNDYLKFEKAVQAREALWIQVATGDASLAATGDTDVPAARALVNQAYSALQSLNSVLGQTDLDQALKLNPKQYGLWATYSMLYMQQQKPDQALDAFHQEIANHPDNLWAYQYMSSALMQIHRPANAEEVLRRLLQIEPSSTEGTLELARILVQEKQIDEAIAVLKPAAHGKDDSPSLRLALGMDEMAAEQKDAGAADLLPIMQASQDPNVLNDISYTLADHDADLPEAAESAAKALQQVEKSTAAIQLTTLTQQDLENVSLLGATWDTVGWIAFKQAKYSDAERYIRAAWLLQQRPDVADHLSQIYEKEGKLAEAQHMRKVAAAIRPITIHVSKTTVPIPAVSRRNMMEKYRYAREVQNLRTIEIPGLPKKSATAQFWIVFTRTGVEEVKILSGEAFLGKAADQIKQHAFPQTFPDAGPVKIVRRGILSCSQLNSTCQLVLLLPQRAQL
jgi:tetratricopeptide (TPR) repeat protein